jgi:hypothetical protein
VTLFPRRDRADISFMRTILPFPSQLPSIAALVAMVLASAAPALSQSLADVARKEGQRRQEQPKAGKVYTNDNLRRDFTASATPVDPGTAAAPGPTDTPPPAAASESDTAGGPKKDEAYWKGRMASAREQLERAQSFALALESQINGLTVDFINRDDPAQRSLVEANRKKAVAEHERVLREIEGHKKAIAAVEDEARKAGVPAGWLR